MDWDRFTFTEAHQLRNLRIDSDFADIYTVFRAALDHPAN
jgi:hypothetical protein